MICRLLGLILLVQVTFAAPSHQLAQRADYPDEVVVLAECSDGKSGAEVTFKDRLLYFQDDYDRRNGGSSQDTAPDIYDPSVHDGVLYHVAWTSGTQADPVKATFPTDGREFRVWDLGTDETDDKPVAGTATLGGAEFKCYWGSAQHKEMNTVDGFKCQVAYTCARSDRWIRHTTVDFDKHVAKVGKASCSSDNGKPYNAKDIFNSLKDVVSHSWDADKGIDIGSNCRMVFPNLHLPTGMEGYDATTPEQIAKILAEHVGAKVEERRTLDKTSCFDPASASGGMGRWREVTQESLEYPHGGRFQITTAKQSDPKSLQIQTRVEFRIECSCESDHGLIGIIQSSLGLFGWVHPAFGIANAALGLFDAMTC